MTGLSSCTGRTRLVALSAGIALLASTTACTTTKEDPTVTSTGTPGGGGLATPASQADSMAQLRAQLDPVIAQLGTVTEVKKDTVVECGGSDGSGGYAATYTVWMTPAGGAQETVSGHIAPRLQAQGWRVEQNPRTDEVDWAFHKDHLDFYTTFNLATKVLAVGGSGACLPDKE